MQYVLYSKSKFGLLLCFRPGPHFGCPDVDRRHHPPAHFFYREAAHCAPDIQAFIIPYDVIRLLDQKGGKAHKHNYSRVNMQRIWQSNLHTYMEYFCSIRTYICVAFINILTSRSPSLFLRWGSLSGRALSKISDNAVDEIGIACDYSSKADPLSKHALVLLTLPKKSWETVRWMRRRQSSLPESWAIHHFKLKWWIYQFAV